MKVVVLGDYPRNPEVIGGGVEAVITNLVSELANIADLDVHVMTLRTDVPAEKVVRSNGITAHYLQAAYRFANLTFFAVNKRRLRRALARVQPDLIHAHIAGTYSQVAFGIGCPAVLTPHGIRHREAKLKKGLINQLVRYPLLRYDERVGVQVAQHIISISPYIQHELSSWIRGQVHPIENPVSKSFFALDNREQPFRLLFAGHINPRKGVYHLVRAMPILCQRFPQVELVLAGKVVHAYDPTYYQTLLDTIEQYHLEPHIKLVGHLDEQALLREYAHCALLVLPSIQETAPMVIEQAMAAGKPVVATTVGGVPYLVKHGESGLLVEHGDVEGLADAISQLLGDDALRARMGQQARAEAERRFHPELVARQTYQVYSQIIR